jgi:hypothetical protein
MSLLKKELIPSLLEMRDWTLKIFNQDIRRPGYPADSWAEKWVKDQFEEMGLKNIILDPVSVKKWEAKEAKLEIWLVDNRKVMLNIPCYPIPYSK